MKGIWKVCFDAVRKSVSEGIQGKLGCIKNGVVPYGIINTFCNNYRAN